MPLRIGFLLTNASLLVFWLALIAAGLGKASYSGASFQEMMMIIRPYLLIFAGSGVGVMLGLWIVASCRDRHTHDICNRLSERKNGAGPSQGTYVRSGNCHRCALVTGTSGSPAAGRTP